MLTYADLVQPILHKANWIYLITLSAPDSVKLRVMLFVYSKDVHVIDIFIYINVKFHSVYS